MPVSFSRWDQSAHYQVLQSRESPLCISTFIGKVGWAHLAQLQLIRNAEQSGKTTMHMHAAAICLMPLRGRTGSYIIGVLVPIQLPRKIDRYQSYIKPQSSLQEQQFTRDRLGTILSKTSENTIIINSSNITERSSIYNIYTCPGLHQSKPPLMTPWLCNTYDFQKKVPGGRHKVYHIPPPKPRLSTTY